MLGNKLQDLMGSGPHLRVRDIAEWSARYVHTKRVRDEAVLVRAMEELIGDTDPSFAYAQGWDAVRGTYGGLSLPKSATINLRGDGLLDRREKKAPPQERPTNGARPRARSQSTVAVGAAFSTA